MLETLCWHWICNMWKQNPSSVDPEHSFQDGKSKSELGGHRAQILWNSNSAQLTWYWQSHRVWKTIQLHHHAKISGGAKGHGFYTRGKEVTVIASMNYNTIMSEVAEGLAWAMLSRSRRQTDGRCSQGRDPEWPCSRLKAGMLRQPEERPIQGGRC